MQPKALGSNRRFRLLVAGWLLILQVPLLAAFPRPTGYVNDFASVIGDTDEAYLEGFLRTLERDTSAEVVVATVSSLEGMTVEEYANRLFADWGIGKKQHDNGVLMLVAPNDRKVRIEVGYGLEGILPDGLAGEIIRTEMIPEFRGGNYPRGVGRGLDRIARIVRRDPAAVARSNTPTSGTRHDLLLTVLTVPFFGTFIAMGAFGTGLGIRSKTFGPVIWGGLFGGVPLLIAVTRASAVSLGVLVPLGMVMFAWGYKKGRSPYWTGVLRTSNSSSDNEASAWMMGGTTSSSAGGSSDTSGSSSSSDFGGGSSGGGGASGEW